MKTHLSEEGLWADNLAARLRSLQASFADDPAATRVNFLAEEVERALRDVPPSKRDACLDALSERFPAWQAAAAAPAESQPPPAPETPEELFERFLRCASQLSPEARTEFGRRLHQAGFGVALPANPLAELSLDLQKKLGLSPNQNLDPARAVKMLAGLLELVLALDQLAWTLWRQIARQPKFQKESDFAKLAGPYLSGDPEVGSQLVAQPVERTRKLIAALLGAVGRVGSAYAKKHNSRFAPEIIEDFARLEKTWKETLESVCWRKYRELHKEHASEAAIENELQEALAKAAENLILGRSVG